MRIMPPTITVNQAMIILFTPRRHMVVKDPRNLPLFLVDRHHNNWEEVCIAGRANTRAREDRGETAG